MSTGLAHDAGKRDQGYKTVVASAARSKGDPVYLGKNSDGKLADVTLVDDAIVHLLGVWDQDVASGESGVVIVDGPVKMTVPSGNYTASHGLSILDGAVVSTGAVYPATGIAGEAKTVFGSITTGGTTVTEIDVDLDGYLPFTATT
jgi:hypothetical protein